MATNQYRPPTPEEIKQFIDLMAVELQIPNYMTQIILREVESVMPRAKKPIEIEVVFTSDMNLDQGVFTPVEREIIMADIAYLKQREHDDGSWDKWKKSQKQLGVRFDDDKIDEITHRRFFTVMGRAPQMDELDRCNCTEAGRIGHRSCGWCIKCQRPVFVCGHVTRRG